MIENQFQSDNSRRKLRLLEKLYDRTKQREPSRARDASLRTLKRRINKFKEEIAVFEAHQCEDESRCVPLADRRGSAIEDQFQLDNTQNKLDRLEELYAQEKQKEASRARDATLRSLKKLINQLKEEIAVFEAHHRAAT